MSRRPILAQPMSVGPATDPQWFRGARTQRDRAIALAKGKPGDLPPGTRIYVSDVIRVRDGNTVYVQWPTDAITKQADGRIVLLDAQGQVQEVFPPSAVIEVEKDAQSQTIWPGQPLPKKYEHLTPADVIR